ALSDVGVGDGVLVNTICPGATDTPRTRGHRYAEAARHGRTITNAEVEEDVKKAGLALRAGRLCEPEEVAHVACFLASEACSYVQASAIYMDGGSRRSTPYPAHARFARVPRTSRGRVGCMTCLRVETRSFARSSANGAGGYSSTDSLLLITPGRRCR